VQVGKCYWMHDPDNGANNWGENLAMVSTRQTVGAAWLDARIEAGWCVSLHNRAHGFNKKAANRPIFKAFAITHTPLYLYAERHTRAHSVINTAVRDVVCLLNAFASAQFKIVSQHDCYFLQGTTK
jgi:hypothetical protein